ncbi:MAG: tRNA methyltransferase, has a role in tRNA modification [Chrysothrix sp. TS-e1954]|nr:MAG: tRNA methyltransferase, has a role in tRNA modification [Chrysothrix sp. TS-e1954]
MQDPNLAPNPPTADPAVFETTHVHSVYNAISYHFSRTRAKPWPTPVRFLKAQEEGSVGVDVGCGSGRYLVGLSALGVGGEEGERGTGREQVRRGEGKLGETGKARGKAIFVIGSDRSSELVAITEKRLRQEGSKNEALVADVLNLPHLPRRRPCAPTRTSTSDQPSKTPLKTKNPPKSKHTPPPGLDFALSIALLHHLSTRARRIAAIAEILAILRDGGRALLFVWALEQGEGSRRRELVSGSGQGGEDGGRTGEGRGRDVMVPWKLQSARNERGRGGKARRGKSRQREGQEGDVGVERTAADATSSPSSKDSATASSGSILMQDGVDEPQVLNRYYHLYASGELEEDVAAAGGEVVEAGWERDNWWVVCEPYLQVPVVSENAEGEEREERVRKQNEVPAGGSKEDAEKMTVC